MVRTRIVRRAKRLVGRSNRKVDSRKTALAPGKRQTSNPHKAVKNSRYVTVRKSTKYTETRSNRADIRGRAKKGKRL